MTVRANIDNISDTFRLCQRTKSMCSLTTFYNENNVNQISSIFKRFISNPTSNSLEFLLNRSLATRCVHRLITHAKRRTIESEWWMRLSCNRVRHNLTVGIPTITYWWHLALWRATVPVSLGVS